MLRYTDTIERVTVGGNPALRAIIWAVDESGRKREISSTVSRSVGADGEHFLMRWRREAYARLLNRAGRRTRH